MVAAAAAVMPSSHRVGAQLRARSLADILAAATPAAKTAGVSRVAELTGLDGLGFPIFQALRPWSRSLATAMGRGVTRRAAVVSALLEAIETDLAERLTPAGSAYPLRAGGAAALATWHGARRDALAIHLDPDVDRFWVDGFDLASGAATAVPFDLVSQDLTRPAMPDTLMATIGLATGGNRTEALGSAIAELLEHDLDADWRRGTPSDRRACELDPATVTDAAVASAMARVAAAGCIMRLWSIGHGHGIAAFLCFIADGPSSASRLPPVGGSGCHPDRAVAVLRAITEAAQGRAAMIAGARDDLAPHYYANAEMKGVELALASLCFGPGPLAWQAIPDAPGLAPEAALELLYRVARARSPLPLFVVPLSPPGLGLDVIKVVAPGLRISERAIIGRPEPPHRPIRCRATPGRRLLFVGPTLWADDLPAGVERRPPAAAGDLAALLEHPPEMVGLIDGCFETGASVWHKEVLDLIAAGVSVHGAASLGALRAAELAEFGMHGTGGIFAAYCSGAVQRDDAVLLVHAPAALRYRPLSLSLVDAEAALNAVDMSGLERRMLQRIARTMSFRTRTWQAILDAFAARTGRPPCVDRKALEAVPSLKRADALQLVGVMLGAAPQAEARARPPLTRYYRSLLAHSWPMPQ